MNQHEQHICDLISGWRNKLIDDLRLHVNMPTCSGHTKGLDHARATFSERAQRLGASTRLIPGVGKPEWLYSSASISTESSTSARSFPPVLVAESSTPRSAHQRPLLLSGHLDTVHPVDSPFNTLTINADSTRATGPGCVDMKGGLVIAFAALEALHASNIHIPWTLILNSDEETGSYHSYPAIFAEAQRIAAASGVGIALEPGPESKAASANWGLVTARAGSGQFIIEVAGKAAHVGRDFANGVSAVYALSDILLRIRELTNVSEGIIVNIGPLEGGTATNVVPDSAKAWGNVRFPNPTAVTAFEQKLRALEGSHASGATVRIHTSFGRPAKPATSSTDTFASLVQQASRELGIELATTTTAGVCDGNIMQHAGLTTLDTLGALGGGLHTQQEWIDLTSIVQRCQLLALVMMRASNAASSLS